MGGLKISADSSQRKIKLAIGIGLFSLSLVLFSISEKERFEVWLIVASTYGFFDFLYQDLFPQWWHWGRWAGQVSDELSEEVVEFVGFFAMGISNVLLGLTLII